MDKINIYTVIVSDRLRDCKEEDVRELAESIKDQGLLNPIVINENRRLIAGGHRLAAYKMLAEQDPKYLEISYINFDEYARQQGIIGPNEVLSEARMKQLEIVENTQRKNMTWQEQVIGIYEYHVLSNGETKWSQQQTAKIFNVSQAYVSPAIRLGRLLKEDTNKTSKLWQIESVAEAIQSLIKDKKAPVLARLREMTKLEVKPRPAQDTTAPAKVSKASADEFLKYYREGSCFDWLPKLAGQFDHIITDPPYGIEMDNFMNAESVENVKEEHDVKENLELLEKFLKVSRECAKETSFLCMWYDVSHHETLLKWAEAAGWTACRWPVTWCKSSPCVNQAAQWNVTKATEVCLMLRAGPKAVLAEKKARNWVVAPRGEVSGEHPFGKPSLVWEYLIEAVSFEGQTILDPFAGCGSALRSIIERGRLPIGIEIKHEHIVNGCNWLAKNL